MNYRVLIVIIFVSSLILSQNKKYPDWFLNQGKLKCDNISVGYANKSYYKDSSFSQAKRNALLSLAQNRKIAIKGEHGFWSTAIGTISMGHKIIEIYDSSLAAKFNNVTVLKTFISGNIAIVLIGEKDCNVNSLLLDNSLMKPEWIDKLPVEQGFIFAIGSSESFYYESSSWLNAEKNARLNLAKQVSIQILSVTKNENSMNNEVSTEDYSVLLKDITVVKRWYDEVNKLFHVLVQMPNKL